MLDTAISQLRFGLARMFGRRIRIQDAHHFVEAMLASYQEYGHLDDLIEMQRAALAPDVQKTMNQQQLRGVARKAYAETAFYRRQFDDLGLDPKKLDLDAFLDLPVTPKQFLKTMPEVFISAKAQLNLRAFTTGTTGNPTSVWFSRYEADLAAALGAISLFIDMGIRPEDVVQTHITTRAILGMQNMTRAAQLIGAAAYPVGQIDPVETLSLLAAPVHLPGKKPQVSVITLYPSYLSELVAHAEDLGYTAVDFGLEHIICGSEILSSGLKARAEALFGAQVHDVYAMTEIFPVGGIVCEEGHLHWSPDQAYVEVLRPDDYQPAQPGEIGVLVVTPFLPYRETTLVLRLDTGDAVRCIDNEGLACSYAHMPATSPVLGKMELSVVAEDGRRFFQRDILELLEGEPTIPLPCRYALHPEANGFALHLLVDHYDARLSERLLARAAEQGLPINQLLLYTDLELMPTTMPIRSDLRELTFPKRTTPQSALLVPATAISDLASTDALSADTPFRNRS